MTPFAHFDRYGSFSNIDYPNSKYFCQNPNLTTTQPNLNIGLGLTRLSLYTTPTPGVYIVAGGRVFSPMLFWSSFSPNGRDSSPMVEFSPKWSNFLPQMVKFSSPMVEFSPKWSSFLPPWSNFSPNGRVFFPNGQIFPKWSSFLPWLSFFSPSGLVFFP